MPSTLPHQPAVEHAPRARTDLVIPGEEPTATVQALSSETAQEILGALGEEPGTVSDLADVVDTSLQNVIYHLDRLREAGLVETVDTWYSGKGREMAVYGLTTERLVFRFGVDEPSGADGPLAVSQ